jgi:hypothetical protein
MKPQPALASRLTMKARCSTLGDQKQATVPLTRHNNLTTLPPQPPLPNPNPHN